MEYSAIVSFHGHACPGLATGYRMARAAMQTFDVGRSGDEDLVAIVENDACGVDALQYLTGCTFGKGNLVFRDYGKNVYSLFSRKTGCGIRVVFHGRGVPDGLREDRAAYAEFLMQCPEEAIIELQPVAYDMPESARIRNSIVCAGCNELVMESRLREVEGRLLCIPCSKLEGC